MGTAHRCYSPAALKDGRVLVAGGTRRAESQAAAILSSESSTETFPAFPPLTVGRDDHRVVRPRDGRLLVTGGEDETSVSIREAETYR